VVPSPYRVANQQRMATRGALEWIRASKPGWFLDMKYHTCVSRRSWHFIWRHTDTTYNLWNSSDLYSMAHGARAEGNVLTRYNWRQTQRNTNEIRKEGLKVYADMTIYAIDPARLVPKMCHHNLPTTIVTSLTLWYIILSSVAKMCAARSHSLHNVLHSPSLMYSQERHITVLTVLLQSLVCHACMYCKPIVNLTGL